MSNRIKTTASEISDIIMCFAVGLAVSLNKSNKKITPDIAISPLIIDEKINVIDMRVALSLEINLKYNGIDINEYTREIVADIEK